MRPKTSSIGLFVGVCRRTEKLAEGLYGGVASPVLRRKRNKRAQIWGERTRPESAAAEL
jgi:hypothetical protein